MKTLRRIYLILAIVMTFVGFIQCYRWSRPGEITIGYLINFLPSAAFAIAYIYALKIKRKMEHAIIIPLCLLALGIWGFVNLGVEIIIKDTTEVTDIRRYDDILDNYWSFKPELVSHFPRPIPLYAKNIRFSFLPKFLQGGTHVQLCYSAPADRISELYDNFIDKRTKPFFGSNKYDHTNIKEGMPTTFFYTSDSDSKDFTDDYEIMIFDKVLNEKERQHTSWNHGQSHGVAISKKKNEIVYWAESW